MSLIDKEVKKMKFKKRADKVLSTIVRYLIVYPIIIPIDYTYDKLSKVK